MPIRRPQISLRGPWARGGRTSAPGPAKGGTDPAAELWSSGMSGEPGSGTDETPPAQQRRRSTDVTGLKPRRVIKSRLLPSPQEDEAADEVRSAAIRVVLVEDVAEVAAHIRGLFRPRSNVNLLDVLSDTRNALDRIRDLDADVVIVDTLLQGRVKGSTLIDRIRKSGLPVGIVAVTVPDRPLDRRRAATVDAVLTMPFGMFDLVHAINDAHVASANRNPTASSRTVALFASKGGVGTTTIAFNLAASLQATGLRTILVDGSLQFGDLRRLLRIPARASSMQDLPTDALRQSDIAGVVFTHTSGIDVLPAPERPEMAELMTDRDLASVFDLLRRSYQAIVIDTASNLTEATLTMLDAADVILQVVTPDPVTIESGRVARQAFEDIGYPPAKLRYVVNRVGSAGELGPDRLEKALGRDPDFTIRSDWQLVTGSNAEGIPFVRARPEAPASVDIRAIAERMTAAGRMPVAPVAGRRPVAGGRLVEARRR